MENFSIDLEYQGVVNSQMFADRDKKSKYSEITGYKNVEAIMALTKLNEETAKDFSFVISELNEEDIKYFIKRRALEMFTVAHLLLEGKKTIKKEKIRNEVFRKIEEYFQWDSISTIPKFAFEVNENEVDWDLPSISVIEQLYPKRYEKFITENNLIF